MTSDPLRTESTGPLGAAGAREAPETTSAERDAKIEQLLLAGLDHYFAAQYDQAVNIWTRALFFDRNHPRARAYIERARRAQAERQRESEELLHNGAIAYRRGDGREARRLLQAALDAGAPFEDTFPMLERLNQLDSAAPPPPSVSRTRQLPPSPAAVEPRGRTSLAVVGTGVVLLALAGAVIYSITSSRVEWMSFAGARTAPAPAQMAREAALGVPTNGELALATARQLLAKRDLRGAMAALDRVRSTDPQRDDADQLLADIQRQLIRSASDSPVSPSTPGPRR
jgi:tetratricopeptide (TPR) repeat protein